MPADKLSSHRTWTVNWAIVLIVIGVLLRLGLWIRLSQSPRLLVQGDGVGYELLARNMIEGHGFSMSAELPYPPDMLRTPGYPLFMAGIYLAVGYRPEIVALVQNILSLITLYIAYRLTVRMFGRREALIAAALMALDVGTIILANVTLTETLFMAAFVPATGCLFMALDSPRWLAWTAAAGILLSLATLVRPAPLFLVFLLLPLIWWVVRRPWRKIALMSAILLVAFVLPLTPWIYRNLQVFGSPSVVLLEGYTFNVHASYVRSALNHTTLAEEMPRIPEEVQRELGGPTADPLESDKLVQVKARTELMQHPLEYAIVYAKGLALMLVLPNTNFLANTLGILDRPTGLIADMRTRSLAENIQALMDFSARFLSKSPDQALFFVALVVEVVVTFLTYALAIVGASVGLRRQSKMTIVLLLVIIGYFFVVTGPIGTGRYRLPAMPYLMMLAGYGIVQIEAWRQARRSRKLGAAQ
jgi:4-amino-4-deoxy-L-arabinose transferase-like glycosyltransferase